MPDKRTVVKKVENATLYSDGLIRIDNVRGSYLHLDKPFSGNGGGDGESNSTPKHSGTAILPKDTHKAAQALCMEAINKLCKDKKWGKVVDGKWKRTLPAANLFVKDGDATGKDEYENAWTVKASDAKRPILRDAKNRSVDAADINNVFYSGCYINMVIKPWAQDNKYGKKINANLVMVQFVKDGEPFGEGRISDADADDILDGAGGDDSDDDDNEDMDDL